MTDIRQRLNDRRAELLNSFDEDAMWVRDGAAPSGPQYERSQRNIAELRDIENTLALMQLADSQDGVAKAQREVAEAQRDLNAQEQKSRSASEETAFWIRRFLTTVAIANAAGLVSVLAGISKTDAPLLNSAAVVVAVVCFSAGTVLGGLYPLLRAAALVRAEGPAPLPHLRRFVNWWYPAITAGLFLGGSVCLVVVVLGYYLGRIVAAT